MTFKNFIHGLYFLALFSISFTACQKDLDLPEPTEQNTEEEGGDAMNESTTNLRAMMMQSDTAGCFEPTLPITFLYEDGTTVNADTEEQLDDIFENEPYPVDIEYPINLVNEETGETAIADNEEELDEFFKDCFGDEDDWEDEEWDEDHEECEEFIETIIGCYELTFPFTLELEDETTITVNNEEELEEAFFGDNPPVDFVFPFTLVSLEDSTSVTVNSEEEIEELLENCEDFYGEWDEEDEWDELFFAFECFTPTFPLTFILEDETTVEVNSLEDIFALVENETYPADIEYPFEVTINETGDIKMINNEEELELLLDYCEEKWEDGEDYEDFFEVFKCFTPSFPIDFILANGETATVNSIEDIKALFDNETYPADVVYPFEVTINVTGETQMINNEEELDAVIEACED